MERRYHMEGNGNVFIETDETPEGLHKLKCWRAQYPRFARRRIKSVIQTDPRVLKNVMVDRAITPWYLR